MQKSKERQRAAARTGANDECRLTDVTAGGSCSSVFRGAQNRKRKKKIEEELKGRNDAK
jgi:hypothetical protein